MEEMQRENIRTLSAILCAINAIPSRPSETPFTLPILPLRTTNAFTGAILPPTCLAHPSPRIRLHTIAPVEVSSAKIFPCAVEMISS